MLRIKLKHDLQKKVSAEFHTLYLKQLDLIVTCYATYPLWITQRWNQGYSYICPLATISPCKNAGILLSSHCFWYNLFKVLILVAALCLRAKKIKNFVVIKVDSEVQSSVQAILYYNLNVSPKFPTFDFIHAITLRHYSRHFTFFSYWP